MVQAWFARVGPRSLARPSLRSPAGGGCCSAAAAAARVAASGCRAARQPGRRSARGHGAGGAGRGRRGMPAGAVDSEAAWAESGATAGNGSGPSSSPAPEWTRLTSPAGAQWTRPSAGGRRDLLQEGRNVPLGGAFVGMERPTRGQGTRAAQAQGGRYTASVACGVAPPIPGVLGESCESGGGGGAGPHSGRLWVE